MTRRFSIALLTVAGLVSAVAALPARADGYRAVDPPRSLEKLALVAKSGPVDNSSLAGRWTLLSVGYTSCPDICPTVLSNLAVVRAAMAEKLPAAAVPRVLFVSVDPARDGPDYLADYAAQFGDGVIGATGKRAAIDALVKTLGAFYRLGRKDRDGFYLVSHSAEVYLIDPQVRLRARFMPPLDPKRTLDAFLAISQAGGPRADAAGGTSQ